jgi:hypothetical protein
MERGPHEPRRLAAGAALETAIMRRTLVALALAASSLTATQPSLYDKLWSFFSSLWGESATKEGCGVNPWGSCSSAPQPQTDEGCGVNPLGSCNTSPQPQTEAGCGVDPYGCPGS